MLKHTKPDPSKVPAFYEPEVNFDFDVPVIEKKMNYVYVLDNFLTEADCNKLITLFDVAPVREEVSVQGLKDVPSGKGSERTTMWSEKLAEMLTEKLKVTDFPKTMVTNRFTPTDSWQDVIGYLHIWNLVGFSPLLRFMKYETGGEHYPHYDAGYLYPDSDYRTLDSVVIYLTTNTSGPTRFIEDGQGHMNQSERNNNDWDRTATDEEVIKQVMPLKGRVLIFNHRLCHDVGKFIPQDEGEIRMIIRGDLIYKRKESWQHSV